MLYRALKMWFWVTYDHLGKLVLLNIACMLPVAVLLGLAFTLGGLAGIVIAYLVVVVACPALLSALGHVSRVLVEKHEAPLSEFIAGVKQFGVQGALVGLAIGSAASLSLAGAYYYLIVIGPPTPLYGYPLAAICLWCGALAVAVGTFALPAIAQKRAGAAAALRTGLLLVADNPIYAFAVTLNLVGLATLALIPPAFLLFSMAPIATLQATAYEMLARKYAAPMVNGNGQLTFDDDADDYLNRGLRDFFFPWKM